MSGQTATLVPPSPISVADNPRRKYSEVCETDPFIQIEKKEKTRSKLDMRVKFALSQGLCVNFHLFLYISKVVGQWKNLNINKK